MAEKISHEKKEALLEAYFENAYPTTKAKTDLALKLNLEFKQINVLSFLNNIYFIIKLNYCN
jgi:hypothetical protein